MSCLFVIWLGDRPIEKLFTSLRCFLWLNIFNRLSNHTTKHLFLMMFEEETNRKFIEKLNLFENEQIYFLTKFEDKIFETKSNLISFDDDHRLVINIEHIDNDYLLKSTKDTSIRVPNEYRLIEKMNSFRRIIEHHLHDTRIIHLSDLQSQYQCELFAILSKIIYPNLKHQFLILAPAVIGNDRPTMKYDETSLDNYIKEILTNVVNERTIASSVIPSAILKLQLMCRKPSSPIHLRSNLEANHDALFLLYTGARLVSILNSYKDKYQTGIYPQREYFHDQLGTMLVHQDEQEFLKWIDSFESKYLLISFGDSNKIEINFDKIFHEFILFSRRLSPYYSKVRILTENQTHLLSTMFARLELIERIVTLLQRILSLINIPLIERM